jgi:hypothetical protein
MGYFRHLAVSDPIWQIFPLAEIEFFIQHLRDQCVSAKGGMDAHAKKKKEKRETMPGVNFHFEQTGFKRILLATHGSAT